MHRIKVHTCIITPSVNVSRAQLMVRRICQTKPICWVSWVNIPSLRAEFVSVLIFQGPKWWFSIGDCSCVDCKKSALYWFEVDKLRRYMWMAISNSKFGTRIISQNSKRMWRYNSSFFFFSLLIWRTKWTFKLMITMKFDASSEFSFSCEAEAGSQWEFRVPL